MMRRIVFVLSALIATIIGVASASSASAPHGGAFEALPGEPWHWSSLSAGHGKGWEPAPSEPWDLPAGARCDFPVHGEPVVDEVVQLVLDRHPDGSPHRVAYKGDLVVRVTNTETGASYDADVSGSAVVEYRSDGSQFWAAHGPVLVGVAEGGGNLPRGLYIVDGVYTMDISSSGYKTVNMLHGGTVDICAQID